ncbi:Transmembrane channel-like protein 5 [Nymphon striatum]|nr:Transmembrane channel-like protein 5 [Nymphon striatum]
MYEKKTLLDLSKTVRFEVKNLPTSRRSAIMDHEKVEIDMTAADSNGTSTVRHRKQPSMDLIRQLPSRNPEFGNEGSRRASLHSRNATRRRKNQGKSLLNTGTIGSAGFGDDEELAEKIYKLTFNFKALRNEIDDEEDVVDAQKVGTTRLRDMKHSLNVKRMVRKKLVAYNNDKPKKIGCYVRIGYSISMGWFVGTEMYYSGYTNNTVQIFSGYYYNMPEAYLYTFVANFIVILIILAYGLAKSYKRNFLITSESISRSLPVKVFCGWDHQIASEDAAELKHNSLFNEISVMVSSLEKTSLSNDCCVRLGNYIVRFFINFMIFGMLIITGFALYTILKTQALESDVPVLRELVIAFVANIIMNLFPWFCSYIVEYEQYESRQTSLYLTLIRSFFMQLVILGILFDHLIAFASKDWEFICWEDILGQEMYRLLVVYFILTLIVTFISDWVRKIIAKIFPSVGKAEFDTATNTMSLIYIQNLCWLGNFFSPLLAIVTMVIMCILFYIKRYSVVWNCRPSKKPWAAAHAQTVFLSLTLISFLLTSIAVGYIILFNMDKTDVVKAKASHGAFKGHVTRKLNSIRHTLTGISDPAFLSDKIIINVEAQLDKLEMSLSKLEYSLNILSDIIPPVDYNTLENEFDVYTSDIDNIRTAIFNLVQAYHKVHAGLEVKSPSLNDTTTPARRFLTTLKPDDLEIDTTLSDFKRWRKQFEDYYYANQMERMNHAEQRAHLRSCMSLKVQNTVIHLLEVNDAANVVEVLDHLQIYYRAALNIMTRRLHFQQCVQKSGETFSDYLIRLRLLGDNAELDNLSYEDRLASHIVAFIHDRDLQKDLLRMDSHDFKSVKEKCLTWEASNRNQLGMNMFTNSSTAINQISTYKKNKRRIHPLRRDSKIDKHCYRCGVIFNVDHINKCPAKEAICKNCGIKGHFQKVCSRPKYGSDIPVKSHAIQVCVAKSLQERSPPTAEVFVSRSTGNSAKIKTTILPDTGATECLVADTVAKKWNIPINRSNIRRIVAANGSELRCLGSMDVRIDWYGRSIVATFFVSPDVSNTVLAWHVLIDLDMIPKEFPLSVRISGRESRSPIHDPDPDDNIICNTTQVTTDSATTKVIAATQQDSSYQAITSKSYADVTKLRLGRLQRTFAPACKSVYRKMSEKETDNAMKKRQDNQEKTEEAYNVRSRRLRLLKVGERVWIHNHVDKTWTRSGVVKQIRSSNRSYIVLSDGSSLVRNRRWLKPFRRGHVARDHVNPKALKLPKSPHPSANFGPFCHQDSIYSIALHVLHDLISIQVIGVIIKLATNPTAVGGVLLLMIILVYYLSAMAKTHKEMTEKLRHQLTLESKDKVFLMGWFEESMKKLASSELQERAPLKPEDRKISKTSLKDIPGVSAISSGIGQVASGVTEVGSKVGQSVLKLKNVMNPMYRDQSRKDRETKSDPADLSQLKLDIGLQPDESPSSDTQSPRSVVTPPSAQHLSGWDRMKKMTSPGSMTPDQMKMRNAFSRKTP